MLPATKIQDGLLFPHDPLVCSSTDLSFGVLVHNDGEDKDGHCSVFILHGGVFENLDKVLVTTILHEICLARLQGDGRREEERGREGRGRKEGGRSNRTSN